MTTHVQWSEPTLQFWSTLCGHCTTTLPQRGADLFQRNRWFCCCGHTNTFWAQQWGENMLVSANICCYRDWPMILCANPFNLSSVILCSFIHVNPRCGPWSWMHPLVFVKCWWLNSMKLEEAFECELHQKRRLALRLHCAKMWCLSCKLCQTCGFMCRVSWTLIQFQLCTFILNGLCIFWCWSAGNLSLSDTWDWAMHPRRLLSHVLPRKMVFF